MQVFLQKGQKTKLRKGKNSYLHLAHASKVIMPVCVQRKPGDLYCDARISYHGGTYSSARGENSRMMARETLQTFREFGLNALANVGKEGDSNPAGSCAEPHAVAEALKRGKENSKSRTIKKIYVSEAYFSTRCKNQSCKESKL